MSSRALPGYGSKQRESGTARKVYTVAEINRRAKQTLEDEIGEVWVEGEISNFIHHSSGHMYFAIKEETASISAALFKGSQRGLNVKMTNGLKIRALGTITVFDRNGRYQIVCRRIEGVGVGGLHAAFEKLKQQLQDEGLFDESRKQPIPLLPRCVGLVTSPTGAAIRDILNVIHRRFPNLRILVAPARVQGDGAAHEIVRAIEQLNEHGDADVMIVGRGGGSMEDLWAFNEEIVARAIAASRIPIISAVGHEIDFTISDFVADRRAETPSAAAEILVGPKEMFERRIRESARGLAHEARHHLHQRQQQVDDVQHTLFRHTDVVIRKLREHLHRSEISLQARSPQRLLTDHAQRLERARGRLAETTRNQVRNIQRQLRESGLTLHHSLQQGFHARKQRTERLTSQLRALGPQQVLDRGYSITRSKDGRVLRAAADATEGERIETLLSRGRLISTVNERKGETDGDKEK